MSFIGMVLVYVVFIAAALVVSFFFYMIWRSLWRGEPPHPDDPAVLEQSRPHPQP